VTSWMRSAAGWVRPRCMMLVRRACSVVLACACAVAGLAGCSSGRDEICVAPHCRIEVIPAHAYALDVTTAGRVRWQVQLGPPPPGSGLQVSPLTVGAVAVFAQDDVLYGLRLADGHRLWSRAVSPDIAGMWRWQNMVVVLTQPPRPGLPLPVLTGLDASTGQPRWTLPIVGSVEALSPTAVGGLAIAMWSNLRGDGALEVVDLSSGRVRWTVPVGSDADPPVAVGGGAVLFAANSQLTSYDDRTGQVRWTEALSALPGGADHVVWQASAGLVYLTGAQQLADGQGAQVLLGISAADGRVRWRVVLRFAHSPPPASLDPYAPGLISVTTSYYSGGISQDELDPATGRVRWQVVSPYPAIATPAGIVTAPGPDQITMRGTLTGQTRWIARLTGGWLPLVTRPGQTSPALPASQALVFPAGPLLVVPAASPDGSDLLAAFRMSDGHPTWQITIPGPVAAPLSAVPGGILVYTVIPQRIIAP
jgi:outer membrane protein assembly factor BamB